MDNPIDDGGPAFPSVGYTEKPGMTLRDYQATEAMGVIMASLTPSDMTEATKHPVEWLADKAYAMADAMIAARRKKP